MDNNGVIDREDLLQKLELVQPGLANKDIVEQATSVVFTGDEIMTYNEEICCRVGYPSEVKGAVQAAPLLGLLHKLPDNGIKMRVGDGELLIKGRAGRAAGIRMEQEILLSIEEVESPGKWKQLPEEFCDAVAFVHECCSVDPSLFVLSCVNICPDALRATDNFQLARYYIEIPTKKPFLVKKESIKHVSTLNMTHISETESWIHFKNKEGLIMSCRRAADGEGFPNIDRTINSTKGTPMKFPDALAEAIGRAEDFSSQSAEENTLLVEIAKGKLRIEGDGTFGWYREPKKLTGYKGPSLKFRISPTLLLNLTKKYQKCFISPERMKVEGDRFTYVTCLGKVE